MYDLPFVPSEKPLIRHMSLMRNCLELLKLIHQEDDDGPFVNVEFALQMMDSMTTCKEFWEELRSDAIDAGLEPDHEALQIKTINPYRYEYQNR